MIRYKCLVIDHDDTSVDSTPHIHYPAFLEAMKILRPDYRGIGIDQYFIKNFDPGLTDFLKKEIGLTEAEMFEEFKIWRSFTDRMIPEFFRGFLDILREYKGQGGIIAVVSHSEKEIIERDYRNRSPVHPDIIFGWDNDETKRKPEPFPVHEIIKTFGLNREDVLVVDDLKTGLVMAKKSGVKFATAGWAYDIGFIRDFMKKNSDYYFSTVREFGEFVLGQVPD
jgi:phosphoglycolate phosphatase-like HAD superfamily hydrolase